MNWQRHHTRDNANCIVSIWDNDKKQWIEKEDTGTESFTEKEKGLASDSFKRACFNFGIGRELYSAPFIWISSDYANIQEGKNGKLQCSDNFAVDRIEYDADRNIIALSIVNAKTKKCVFEMGKKQPTAAQKKKATNNTPTAESGVTDEISALIALTNSDEVKLCEYFKVAAVKDLTEAQATKCIQMLKSKLK